MNCQFIQRSFCSFQNLILTINHGFIFIHYIVFLCEVPLQQQQQQRHILLHQQQQHNNKISIKSNILELWLIFWISLFWVFILCWDKRLETHIWPYLMGGTKLAYISDPQTPQWVRESENKQKSQFLSFLCPFVPYKQKSEKISLVER